MRTCHDTSAFGSAERFAFWKDVVCKNYVSASAAIEADELEFSARLVSQDLGPIRVGEFSAPLHHWSRSPRDVRRDDQDVYILSLANAGKAELNQFGRRVDQGVGDIVMYDCSAPFDYSMGCDAQLVKIPKAFLESRIVRPRGLVAVRFSDGSPLVPMLASLIKESCNLDLDLKADALIGARLANSIVDIVVAMCDLYRDTHSVADSSWQLERIMRYARANIASEELTPEKLASVGGMSVRSLNRLFAAVGTTPMRWIWERRLEGSRTALYEKRVGSVTEAAFMYGFNDLGHFSRSFKRAYGITPLQAFRD